MPDCCAVIVCWQSAEDAIRCVESLRRAAPGTPVVLVDNGSGDGSAGRLRAALPDADVLALPDNLGFGAGCNRGIERALARHHGLDYVLLVNPDIVAEPGFLDRLVPTARETGAVVTGARIVSMDGARVLYENGRFRPWTLGRSHVPAPPSRDVYDTEFITGALMLVDAEALRDGLRFDERYFMYVEDLDFCREAVRRGRRLVVDRRAVVRHEEGGTQRGEDASLAGMRPSQLRWITRNKVFFARKRLPLLQRLVFLAIAFLAKPVAGVVAYRSVAFLRTYYAALCEGLRMPLR